MDWTWREKGSEILKGIGLDEKCQVLVNKAISSGLVKILKMQRDHCTTHSELYASFPCYGFRLNHLTNLKFFYQRLLKRCYLSQEVLNIFSQC